MWLRISTVVLHVNVYLDWWLKMDEFIKILREKFEDQLSNKTGWGRNEVMIAFDKACIGAIITYATKKNINLM